MFTDHFFGVCRLWFFYLRQTFGNWFNKPHLLHVLPFAMQLSWWLGSQLTLHFEHTRGGRLLCLWKLLESNQFDDQELEGYWIAFTLAGMRVLLCCWFWCCFRIPSCIFIARSNACLGSAVCLGISFWISRSIRFRMNTSHIRVSYFFSRSQFSVSSLSFA